MSERRPPGIPDEWLVVHVKNSRKRPLTVMCEPTANGFSVPVGMKGVVVYSEECEWWAREGKEVGLVDLFEDQVTLYVLEKQFWLLDGKSWTLVLDFKS